MTMGVNQDRRRGRPATRKDKNRRPMPVGADRDRPMTWLFALLPHHPDFGDVLQSSGDERFLRLYDALHDDAYRNTSPGKCVAGSVYHCVTWSNCGASTTGYWESRIRQHTSHGSWRISLTMR